MKKYLFLFVTVFAIIFISCNNSQTVSSDTNLSAVEYSDKMKELPDAPVIDVRSPEEFSAGHLKTARNIAWTGNNFEKQISTLDKSKPVFVYCLSGNRSSAAAGKMRSLGFSRVYELKGGIMKWRGANLPLTTLPSESTNSSAGMSKSQFDEKLISSKLVLVDFYADWCIPCKEMKPYLDEISKDLTEKVEIVRINVDENQELYKELKIDAIPELQLYKNKIMVWNNSGFIGKTEVIKIIQTN